LYFKDPKTATPEPEPLALAGQHVLALAEDRSRGIWAGTHEGQLWHLSQGHCDAQTNFTQVHAITAMVPDTNSSLWIGTEGGGLYRYRDGVQAHLEKGRELLSGLIRALYLDAAGTLWIGTAGGGLSRWRTDHLVTFTTGEGLADNTISQIVEDDAGRLWLGGNRGLSCVSKSELEDLAAGKISLLSPQVYGRADGMLSEECTGDFCPAGLKTRSGLLWFSTLKGLVAANPQRPSAGAPPPQVVIEETLIDGAPALMSGPPPRQERSTVHAPDMTPDPAHIELGPGKHRLEIHYTGLSLGAPERIRFRYQLESLNPDWVPAGAQRSVSYGYLPPGNYRFRVSACNSDGVWSDTDATLAVTVLPRFWQNWWVLSLGGLGLLATVSGAARFVEKRKLHHRLRHLEREHSIERERARIAQDLHDDLGSSLTRISLLSDLVKADKDAPKQVEAHASKISQSAAQTVRALEEIVWALRPGSDSLHSLVDYIAHAANELFEGDRTRCRLDFPHELPARSLPPEMRHNIFLVVKEALTNALKHAEATEVRVQAKASERSLEIVVQDDGRGFEPGGTAKPGKQHGLGNMRRRAEAMGGSLSVESAPGKGTKVRLAVRFAANPAG
jgi:signal transduction histidine kinase